ANPLRKRGILAPLKELLVPYQPSDYRAIVAGDREASGGRAAVHGSSDQGEFWGREISSAKRPARSHRTSVSSRTVVIASTIAITNIASDCRSANIVPDHAMIPPDDATPSRVSESTSLGRISSSIAQARSTCTNGRQGSRRSTPS